MSSGCWRRRSQLCDVVVPPRLPGLLSAASLASLRWSVLHSSRLLSPDFPVMYLVRFAVRPLCTDLQCWLSLLFSQCCSPDFFCVNIPQSLLIGVAGRWLFYYLHWRPFDCPSLQAPLSFFCNRPTSECVVFCSSFRSSPVTSRSPTYFLYYILWIWDIIK